MGSDFFPLKTYFYILSLFTFYCMDYSKFLKKRNDFTDKIFSPIVNFLLKLNITPNMLSVLSGLILALSAYSIHALMFNFAIIGISLSVLLDLLDGALARRKKLKKYGFLFDAFIDYCFDTLILIAFYSIGLLSFETLIFTISSVFFFTIAYSQYKLYKKKEHFILPIGLRYFYLFFLLFPIGLNNVFNILGFLFLIESILLFKSV